MAFSTKRVWYSGAALDVLPTSHGLSTQAAAITNDIKAQALTFNISTDSIPNSTKTTASTALNTAIVAAVDAQIGTAMGVDTSGNTVSYNFKVTNISRGLVVSDIFYDEATDVYVVTGSLTVDVS